MFKRILSGHGTIVAYTGLFLGLVGTSWAAAGTASDGPSRASATIARGAPKVKVKCTATRGGHRVACIVASGSGPRGATGPRGLPGPPGVPGPPGAAGPTAFTTPPAYTITGIPNGNIHTSNETTDPNLMWHRWQLYSQVAVAPGTGLVSLSMPLLDAQRVNGSPSKLSVEFCYGLQDSTDTSTTNLSITRATVHQLTTPSAPASAGPVPGYTTATLIDQPLNITTTTTGSTGCQTVASAGPVTPGSLLTLDLQVSFVAPAASTGGKFNQGWLYLGRVTTTFSP